jgi:hypothetical protein
MEGRDATAVRPNSADYASPAVQERVRVSDATDAFLSEEVKPHVPAELHRALDRVVAHVETPFASLQQLASWVEMVRTGQGVAIGRAGWPEEHSECAYYRDLVLLEKTLAALNHPESGRHL